MVRLCEQESYCLRPGPVNTALQSCALNQSHPRHVFGFRDEECQPTGSHLIPLHNTQRALARASSVVGPFRTTGAYAACSVIREALRPGAGTPSLVRFVAILSKVRNAVSSELSYLQINTQQQRRRRRSTYVGRFVPRVTTPASRPISRQLSPQGRKTGVKSSRQRAFRI